MHQSYLKMLLESLLVLPRSGVSGRLALVPVGRDFNFGKRSEDSVKEALSGETVSIDEDGNVWSSASGFCPPF